MAHYSSWIPDRPTSKGATAYHDAVVNTSWHKQNINALISILKNKIKPGDTVVDFGAGTGASAIYLLPHVPEGSQLLLIDNSPSWLGKAYEILNANQQVKFVLLEKNKEQYKLLGELLGKESVEHITSANTVHLIPDITKTFKGIHDALKVSGTFTFQSGNIAHTIKENGILMIDDSINKIHDIALDIIRTDETFSIYKKDLNKRIKQQFAQRKFVFPDPRPVEFYLKELKKAGFKNEKVIHKHVKVKYADWLKFLKVRRLQAGILPEIGGKDASLEEEHDRDDLITKAAMLFYQALKTENPFANNQTFTAEWTYVQAEK